MKKLADIGLIGLAVMGENLALNMEINGYTVAVYNRTVQGIEEGVVAKFIEGRGKEKNFIGNSDLKLFVESIERPRKIMMMIRAGQAVDDQIDLLLPYLDQGDILIDGGNSHFPDTSRRTKYLESKGFLFIGTGVSGGEEGALNGPSIMPGGSVQAWPQVKEIFQAISAKIDGDVPCCGWVGENGAGHFVKMVHNGIEYGDMQLICEVYQIMKDVLNLSSKQMHEIFRQWNMGDLGSYLIEITSEILKVDDIDGLPLVDKILDSAGQKGTGKWTGITAFDLGVPLTLIAEAVYARCLSSMKEERTFASKIYQKKNLANIVDIDSIINDLKDALYASKIISYAQGYQLMREAAKEFNWNLNYGGIATMWRGGCIIRSVFLSKINEAFEENPQLPNLLLAPFFIEKLNQSVDGWRRLIVLGIQHGIPVPALSSALAYFDGYRTENLPASLLQAQRDYFGAHTYERKDAPRGKFFHTNWTGEGGKTVSGSYNL